MRYDRLTLLINLFVVICALTLSSCNNDDSAAQESVGQGGSMTRFAIYQDNLYAVSNKKLVVYDISNNSFTKVNEQEVGWTIETIFARYPYLYIGSNQAMYIYSIQNVNQPAFVFQHSHMQSCDPVVVQGNRAYVTMRGGTICNSTVNMLEILDISEPTNTVAVASYPMESPYGLGVNGNYLFLCEGENGFKVYDISNETDIKLLKEIEDFHAYDVIVQDSWLAVTGDDGIFQFQYPDAEQVVRSVGSIPVQRN